MNPNHLYIGLKIIVLIIPVCLAVSGVAILKIGRKKPIRDYTK